MGLAAFQSVEYFGRTSARILPTGKSLSLLDRGVDAGGFPCNLVLSPSGRFLVSTTAGQNQTLLTYDTVTGSVFSEYKLPKNEHLFFGLSIIEESENGLVVAASMSKDEIRKFLVDPKGKTYLLGQPIKLKLPFDEGREPNPAGLAHIPGSTGTYGKFLVTYNHAFIKRRYRSFLALVDSESGQTTQFDCAGYPLDVAYLPDANSDFKKAFVTSERDNCVSVIEPGKDTRRIAVGQQPSRLLLHNKTLYVANSNSDSISVIDAESEEVLKTILVRPTSLGGLPGCTPMGMAIDDVAGRLYVTLADLNAVAVLNINTGNVEGYLPTAWYPTAVALSKNRKELYVACAKGSKSLNPNALGKDRYILARMKGSLQTLDLVDAATNIGQLTQQVLQNSMAANRNDRFENPGIKHVIYVIKENRTYDQVFGDVPHANGNDSLCIFPKKVTPNLHALAQRFGLLDNFYVCAEVSEDGWSWSTRGIANEYVQRTTNAGYSGGSRSYDSEGQNSGTAPNIMGMRDVAEGAGGTLWDAVLRSGKTVRNYGCFVAGDDTPERDEKGPLVKENEPVMKSLVGRTCPDFRQYDTAFPDSEAWAKMGIPNAPGQLASFGKSKVNSRFSAFAAEFKQYEKNGTLPDLCILRFPRDHTAGTATGQSTPAAMVADNDYAVGQLVDLVSHSKFWKDTAIFVLEDDAQAGFDHVDAHRSTALVISPYTERNPRTDSRFYNTNSFLRTMQAILGAPPMTQYVGTAPYFKGFTSNPHNLDPYVAILPDKEVISGVNGKTAYRAKDSALLVKRGAEDNRADRALNDILWHSIKGLKAKRPLTPGSQWEND